MFEAAQKPEDEFEESIEGKNKNEELPDRRQKVNSDDGTKVMQGVSKNEYEGKSTNPFY